MFQLSKIRDRVYSLKFDDRYELCMTFLRYEEFYESPNDRFRNHSFTLVEYMSWYSHTFGDGNFTYPTDWGGFNIPVDVIAQVHDRGIPDPNHYDTLMRGIYGFISSNDPTSYLIGYTDGVDVKDHELTHAMFYVNEEYRNEVHKIVATAGEDLIKSLSQVLYAKGYAPNTVIDEIQAYITTGEVEMFDEIQHPNLDKLRAQLIELHQKHFKTFYDSAGNVSSNLTQDAKAESDSV